MIDHGAQPFDHGQSEFFIVGAWTPRIDAGLFTLALSRPFLEHYLREWVRALPNAKIRQSISVSALCLNLARTGVRTAPEAIHADLVIDSTRRNTRLPQWLLEAGIRRYRRPRLALTSATPLAGSAFPRTCTRAIRCFTSLAHRPFRRALACGC